MKEATPHRNQLDGPSLWFVALFFGALTTTGIISLLYQSEGVSATENRSLAGIPQYGAWFLFSGAYSDSLELYYADNFPMREPLVQAATAIRGLSGYRGEIAYYQAEPVEPEIVPVVQADTLSVAKPDSIATLKVVEALVEEKATYDKSSGVVVYGNRAIQLFTSSSEGARKYAEMINLYQATFDTIDVFSLVAPTQIDFYLPGEYKKSSNYESKTVNAIHARLDSTVHFVDAYSELERHKDEYIYFNTDHHWTGRGAYYAYVAFCHSAGLQPVSLDSLEKRQIRRKFLGSLYSITLDKGLKSNRDSVEYFVPRIPLRAFRWNVDSARYEFARVFTQTHNYANFIGGDLPLVRIESEVNRERILVIKDSFGNAVAPLLALHYGTVYVMDYRYFDVNVRRFVRDNHIGSILFLHNTFAANAKYTSYRGRNILNWYPVPKKQEEAKVDTIVTDDQSKPDD
jgi:hypothetical protein